MSSLALISAANSLRTAPCKSTPYVTLLRAKKAATARCYIRFTHFSLASPVYIKSCCLPAIASLKIMFLL